MWSKPEKTMLGIAQTPKIDGKTNFRTKKSKKAILAGSGVIQDLATGSAQKALRAKIWSPLFEKFYQNTHFFIEDIDFYV